MRHRKVRGNLSRTSAHRRAMLNNMVTSLFTHERIRTTAPKAKAARRVAERMITRAKSDTLHARRLLHRRIRDAEVLKKLFAVLGPRYLNRPGGYTRIIRLAPRPGDGAEVVILELVDRFGTTTRAGDEKKTKRRAKKEPKAAAPSDDEPAAETDAQEAESAGETGEVDVEVDSSAEATEASKKPVKKRRGLLRRRKRSE